MKLRAEVLGVETNGDSLQVKCQVTERAAARWRNMTVMRFEVMDIPRNQKTFRIGRFLNISLEAE